MNVQEDTIYRINKLRAELSRLHTRMDEKGTDRSATEYLISDLLHYCTSSLDHYVLHMDSDQPHQTKLRLSRLLGLSRWRDEMLERAGDPAHRKQTGAPHAPPPAQPMLRDLRIMNQRKKTHAADSNFQQVNLRDLISRR